MNIVCKQLSKREVLSSRPQADRHSRILHQGESLYLRVLQWISLVPAPNYPVCVLTSVDRFGTGPG